MPYLLAERTTRKATLPQISLKPLGSTKVLSSIAERPVVVTRIFKQLWNRVEDDGETKRQPHDLLRLYAAAGEPGLHPYSRPTGNIACGTSSEVVWSGEERLGILKGDRRGANGERERKHVNERVTAKAMRRPPLKFTDIRNRSPSSKPLPRIVVSGRRPAKRHHDPPDISHPSSTGLGISPEKIFGLISPRKAASE